MPTFNVFDSNRFTKEFGERYMGAIVQSSFGYDAAPKLEKLLELTEGYQSEKKIDPVNNGPPTRYEDCSETELAVLLVFASLSLGERETFMIMIRWLSAKTFAGLN